MLTSSIEHSAGYIYTHLFIHIYDMHIVLADVELVDLELVLEQFAFISHSKCTPAPILCTIAVRVTNIYIYIYRIYSDA